MENTAGKTLLLDKNQVFSFISAVTQAIVSEFSNREPEGVVLLGIQRHGVPLARIMASEISKNSSLKAETGTLDISMYRDDIGVKKALGVIHETDIPCGIDGRVVILVDDVLHTGRTIRAALDAITDYGRPRMIRLAGLIDRGHHEFPIRADYTGTELDVPDNKRIRMEWDEPAGSGIAYEADK